MYRWCFLFFSFFFLFFFWLRSRKYIRLLVVSHKRGVPFGVIKVKTSSISCRFSNNEDDSVSICFGIF